MNLRESIRRKLITEGYYCWHVSGHYPNGNAKCSRHVCGAPGYHHHTTTPVNSFNSEPSWDSYFDCSASVGPPPEGGDPTSVGMDFVSEPEEFEISRPSQGRLDKNIRESIIKKLREESIGGNCPDGCYCKGGDCSKVKIIDGVVTTVSCDKSCATTPADTTGGGGKKRPPTMNKKKRKKEQTTAGAAGAYSTSLSVEPIKRKFFQEGIKETELISLIEKAIYSARYGGVIEEALTDSDEKRIGVLARKELKDYENKLEKKIDRMITKSFKGKSFEDATVKIARNAIVQLYKALWIRRSFWTNYITNTSS